MYHIDLKMDKPNIGKMLSIMQDKMHRGIRLADCKKIRDCYVNLKNVLSANFEEQYGIKNPNSPKQISKYIEMLSLKIEPGRKNEVIEACYNADEDKWTTDAQAMEILASLGYEFAQDLLDYRHAKKYAETIESIMSAADGDNLIHPEVSLGKTNRLNYSKPGLMTIPKKLLWNVLAPYNEGNALFSVDIKNQEPSILINMTGADELKYALRSADGLYETIYRQCFKPSVTANVLIDTFSENRRYEYSELKKLGTVSPALYTATKPVVNGYYYKGQRIVEIETVCIGSEKGVYPDLPNTIAVGLEDGSVEQVNVIWETVPDKVLKRSNNYTVKGALQDIEIRISKQEKKEFKQSYLAISYGASIMGIERMCKTIDGKQVYKYVTGISAIKNYRSKIKEYAKNGVTTIRTIFGTPVFADTYDSKKLERMLLDLPIQGSGADILSLLVMHFYDYINKNGLADIMDICFTRHDELIIEVKKEYLESVGDETVVNTLRDMFEHQIDDWEPFKVEITKTEAAELDIDLADD